jgi:hypothetical protein
MNKYFFLPILTLLLLLDCASGMAGRKLIHRDNKSAFYSLRLDELSDKDQVALNPPFSPSINSISPENWKGILGNLKFKKESSVGNMIFHVFAEDELDDLVGNIPPSLKKLDSNQILVIVSKFNDLKSVVSKDHRTFFAVFMNNNGLNIIFREIHEDMMNVNTTNYYEWSQIPDLYIRNNYESYYVEENGSFSYGKNNGFNNRLWLVFPSSTVKNILFTPRKSEEPELEGEDILRGKEDKKSKAVSSPNNSSIKTEQPNSDTTPPKTRAIILRELD